MDFSGRVNRRRYIIAQLILMPVSSVTLATLGLAIWNLDHSFPTKLIPTVIRDIALPPSTAWTLIGVAAIVGIVSLVANLSFTVRRLHDLDFSGWFMVLWPILMLLQRGLLDDGAGDTSSEVVAFEAVLMMVPGVAGANIYGANPRLARSDPPTAVMLPARSPHGDSGWT